MGPSRARDQKLTQDDVKALLREKDDRIAALETRLEAYGARASTAQTRLLKTIDVLDALRSQHALEIAAEEQAKVKLTQEVNRWRSVASELEVEKDELKDVVEDLIQKAGCTSSNTQRGNLNSRFPEQVVVGAIDNGGVEGNHNNDLLAYATSIIARLRMELDIERQNHSRAVEEANLRIEELEAKLAVREAELEHNVVSVGDCEQQPREPGNDPVQAFEKKKLTERLPKPQPLSDEECIHFLESNNARNRSLEIEIRQIAERLEQARSAASPSGGTRQELQLPVLQNSNRATVSHIPRTRSASVDPNVLSRPPSTTKNASPPPSTVLSIAQLDNQIRTMTTRMDALKSERTTLIEAAARQRRVTDGINMDTFQDILRVEAECVRLQAEVDDLREQLQHSQTTARAREKVLLHEIAQLRASSASPSVPPPAPDLHRIFSARSLEDDIASEESMELASPLVPIVLPNPFPEHLSQSLGAEVDLLSFPFSPRHMSSPAPDVPPTPPRTTRRSPGPQDIERVQAALDVARTRLAQKEEALVQLRAEMERLQLEGQAQTRGDGDQG